jgi:type III pantothenate kinase
MPTETARSLIAVDIGNSRIKLGRFEPLREEASDSELPVPGSTLDLPIAFHTGEFDEARFAAWCHEHVASSAPWMVASVHQGAVGHFRALHARLASKASAQWPLHRITFMDLDMHIRVESPASVGIDRLLAALAANRLRRSDRAAIVIDLGSAITVDLVDAHGAFQGGAILPGIAMSARALADQTDALPQVDANELGRPPEPLGKSTVAAIESGLYWGAVGAIRELIRRLSIGQDIPPDVFLTGGASALVTGFLAQSFAADDARNLLSVRHVPNLVLSGIALVDQMASSR